MKKYILAIACLLSAMTGFAQDALNIENATVKAGETGTLNVILTNTEKTYINCQFDFTLPAGLDVQRTSAGKVSKKTCALTARSINEDDEWEFSYTLAEPSAGLFRVTMYNDGNLPFMGKSGEAIMTLTVTAASDFVGGTGKISAIVVTDTDRNSIELSDATFTVSETSGIETVNTVQNTDNAPVYDLSGRRVTKAAKGIYIKNGKKFIVK